MPNLAQCRFVTLVGLIVLFAAALRAQGTAVSFNGTTQYAQLNAVAGDLASSTTHTIEFWFKAGAQVEASEISLFAVNTSAGGNVFIINLGDGNVQDGKVYLYDGTAAVNIISGSTDYRDNEPHHLALVRNGSTATLYIDGTSIGSGTASYTLSATNLWSAGTEFDSGPTATDFFTGSIDDIRIWTTARSADTLRAHMVALTAASSGLAGWWKCDDGSGTVLADASGNGNNGALTGGAAFIAPFMAFQEVAAGLAALKNSASAWGDFDNDGDLDLVVSGYSYSTFAAMAKIYRNTAGSFSEVYAGSLTPVENCTVEWGDHDNDGDLDLLVCGAGSTKVYQNSGSGFAEVYAGSLAALTEGVARWGDMDNDGDLDIVESGGGYTYIYRNTGSGYTAVYAGQVTGAMRGDVAWGDFDNDGLLDIVLCGFNGSYISRFYRNTGDGFTLMYAGSVTGVEYSTADWGDYDNDGDLDLFITGVTSGLSRISKLYQNTGAGFSEVFAGTFLPVDNGAAAWGDYDNDGDLDILITGDTADYKPAARIYQNIGGGFAEVHRGTFHPISAGAVAWGDYDADGDLDLVLTGENSIGVTKLYRNTLPVKNTVPTAPTGLTATVTGSGVVLQWNKSTDAKTPQNGLTYNVRIGTVTGGADKKSPMASLTTGYRRVAQLGNANSPNAWTVRGLPQGTYYWSVQAVDHSFAGSAFAAQGTFTVTPFAEHTGIAATGVIDGSTSWGDYDNDGDLDFVVTGYNAVSGAVAKLYQNTGSAFTEVYPGSLTPVSSGGAAWGDNDRDGDLDLLLHGLASGTAVTKVYENTGSGFTEAAVGALTGVYSGAAVWEDYNGDGSLDIVLTGINGSSRVAKIYQNIGAWFFEVYTGTLTGLANGTIATGDFDKDGDADILITGENGVSISSKIYRNTGLGFTEVYPGAVLGLSYGSAAWGDYDNDGDLDIVVTGVNGIDRHSKVYQNTGSGFTEVYAGSLTGVESGAAAWGDGDGDGDLDILLTGLDGATRVAKLYQNTGSGFTEMYPGSLPPVSYSAVAWGDGDNDGRLDVLLAGSSSSGYITKVYRNILASANTPPSVPTGPTATVSAYTAILHWEKSTDTQTAQNSITYNLRIGTMPGGSDVLSPMSSTATGYRRVPRPGSAYHTNDININWLANGKYYWSVQAVDHGFAGSPFSAEGSFVIADYTPVTGAVFTGAELGVAQWGDFDNDGDLDVVVTGNTGSGGIAKIYRNTVGTFAEVYAGQLTGVTHGAAAWGDYDLDGDLDIVLTGYVGATRTAKLYENTGSGFTEEYAGTLTPAAAGTVEWGDMDNDGDLDLLQTGLSDAGAVTKVYRNTGSGFTEAFAGSFIGVSGGNASWGDLDSDGRLDIVITGSAAGAEKTAKLYRNTGSGFTEMYPGSLTPVDNSSAVWGDYDADGDADLLLHGHANGGAVTKVYQNTGSGFTEVYAGSLTGIYQGDAAWGDYDNDGDLDIVLSGYTGSVQVSKVYRNTGSGFTETNVDALFPGTNCSVTFADYDKDRDLDLLVKGKNGAVTYFTRLYKNDSFVSNAAPAAPGGLTSTVDGNNVTLKWQKGTDDHTAQNGLSYNLFIGTSPAVGNVAPPHANIDNGFRRIPKTGNVNQNDSITVGLLPPGFYYWTVQAVDNSFIGSPFAAFTFFSIVTPLPVELISFTGLKKGKGTELLWSTATETDNLGFEVERRELSRRVSGTLNPSVDESMHQWSRIAFIPGHGTTNAPQSYSYIDAKASGRVEYRLKQLDRDGSFSYSQSVEMDLGAPAVFELTQNYPNPFNPSTLLAFTVPVTGRASLTVYNSIGQRVATLFDGVAESGVSYERTFDASSLASGVYVARLQGEQETRLRKMVLMK